MYLNTNKCIIKWIPNKQYITNEILKKYRHIKSNSSESNKIRRKLNNILIVLELFNLIDFYSRINYIEEKFYKFYNMSDIEKIIFIIE